MIEIGYLEPSTSVSIPRLNIFQRQDRTAALGAPEVDSSFHPPDSPHTTIAEETSNSTKQIKDTSIKFLSKGHPNVSK